MSWLRAKLENDPTHPAYLQTVRGVGYRFAVPVERL
jgi:DNA-binding response OmpR family regulator